jgi:glycosyltransferase involved in cell wall biosynthesis/peptidoglycan/xylan/chitin deacetylase (PgdA/CDA1 family)
MSRLLRVLTYHRILDPEGAHCSPSVISASPAVFREQARRLATRYRVVAADEVLDSLRTGRLLPSRAVLITFDDGCRDFGETAWPILREFRLSATLFVPTAYPGAPDSVFWWDRLHAALAFTPRRFLETPAGRLALETPPERLASLRVLQRLIKTLPHLEAMRLVETVCRELGERQPPPSEVMSWDQIRALSADGVTIAAHTRTHPALTRLPTEAARAEIRGSVEDLKRELGAPPRVFAYPFGDHDLRIARLVKEEGLEMALTCLDGHNRLPGTDPFLLRRTNITPRTQVTFLPARLTAVGGALDRWRHGTWQQQPRAEVDPGVKTAAAPRSLKLAYIMSRFPKLSETFVLNEITACAVSGIPVEVFPLLRERQPTAHPEADEWVRRAHFHPFLSRAIVSANLQFIREQPAGYARLVLEVLRKTAGSLNFFVGALGIFAKSVRFALEMREAGVSHVHAHFATHPALAAFIVHRLTGIPFSFTAHGSDLHVDRRMLDTKVAAARFAVTISDFNREVIVRECGEHVRPKVHVVHCGVDPDTFAPRSAEGRAGRSFRIVCVASFEEVKGHRYLVEACRLLCEQGVDLECHLIGEGPLRRDVERRAAAAGLDRAVVFHGGLPRPAVAQLLSGADAAVLASHPTPGGKREGIPVALMEAMASGLPVVATAISGIPELVESGVSGFLVPSGDAAALGAALGRLAGDPELRAQMGRAGRARVVRDFNLWRNTEGLVRLFAASDPAAVDAMQRGIGRALAS